MYRLKVTLMTTGCFLLKISDEVDCKIELKSYKKDLIKTRKRRM